MAVLGPTDDAVLRRLRLVGALGPVVFIVALQLARPVLIDRVFPQAGDAIVGWLTVLAAVLFGWWMYAAINVAHQRTLDLERQRAAMQERDRIARELHDSIAQVLGFTHLRLRTIAARPEVRADAQLRGELDEVADVAQEAYTDVREAIGALHHTATADTALLDVLQSYADGFARRSGIHTVVHTAGPDPALDEGQRQHVVRIVQEALTNVRKHAASPSATIRVTTTPQAATVEIADDGCGFDAEAGRDLECFGLRAMRERAELIGARLHVHSAPGAGTRVVVDLSEAVAR